MLEPITLEDSYKLDDEYVVMDVGPKRIEITGPGWHGLTDILLERRMAERLYRWPGRWLEEYPEPEVE